MMKDNEFLDAKPDESIDSSKVSSLLENIEWLMHILQNEPIPPKDNDVLLFLLSACKDGFVDYEIFDGQERIKENFYERIRNPENCLSEKYKPILDIFEKTIDRISYNSLEEIFVTFIIIDKEFLASVFTIIFDAIIGGLARSQVRYGGEFFQPKELTMLISALSDLHKDARIFDPFAGLASFGIFRQPGVEYFGQEINPKTWALGALRIMAYGRSSLSHYVCDDSILHWPTQNQKFDLIVSIPPFGFDLRNRYGDIHKEFRSVEGFLLEKGKNSLSIKGKLITVFPKGKILWGKSEEPLRKTLVDSDLIDTIIYLPGSILLNTAKPLVILVINKDKKIPGQVRLIDAKKFVKSNDLKENVLDDNILISIANEENQDSEAIQIVYNQQIRDLDYNLFTISRFFQKDFEGVKLSEVLEIIRGTKNNLPNNGKLVRISDLKNDNIDYQLDCSTIEVLELKGNTIKIDEPCILMAARWRKLKPTLFKYEGEPIYITRDILPVKVNESIANVEYLINELHADYVEDQIASFRLGDTIPFIRPKDLLDVKIKLPSLAEQNAKIEGVQELTEKIKLLQVDRNALANGLEIEKFKEFASLKHTLGRPRQNILDWSDNLLHFLSSSTPDIDKLNMSFADFYDLDIISALKEIKRDINFITDVLEKGEKGINPKEFEKELIPLTEINSMLNGLSSNGLKFRLVKLLIQGEKLKERGVEGSKILFKVLFDNLLTNADKHAFLVSGPGNEVRIELSEEEETLVIEIKNNGERFPQNFDREKFITKYSTANSNSGSGLGGYDVHRIADYFGNPDWELILNQDPIYRVWFRFQFPIKIME